MSRALLFDALKALEGVKDAEWDADSVDGRRLIAALRAALAEQPAAPVLTDAEIERMARLYRDDYGYDFDELAFARAIIAAAIPPGCVVVPVGEVEALRQELETERVRLAACGVVALADTPESASKARDMLPQYRSASCADVARRVDECMNLRGYAEELRKALQDIASGELGVNLCVKVAQAALAARPGGQG